MIVRQPPLALFAIEPPQADKGVRLALPLPDRSPKFERLLEIIESLLPVSLPEKSEGEKGQRLSLLRAALPSLHERESSLEMLNRPWLIAERQERRSHTRESDRLARTISRLAPQRKCLVVMIERPFLIAQAVVERADVVEGDRQAPPIIERPP